MTSAVEADAVAGFDCCRKPTRRDAFLAESQTLVPWERRVALIEPHYFKPCNGRSPIGLERIAHSPAAALVQLVRRGVQGVALHDSAAQDVVVASTWAASRCPILLAVSVPPPKRLLGEHHYACAPRCLGLPASSMATKTRLAVVQQRCSPLSGDCASIRTLTVSDVRPVLTTRPTTSTISPT